MSFWKPGTTQAPSSKKQEGGEVKNSQHDNKVVRNGRDTADKDVKTTLSKGVMTMKFMKRKADADLESINIAEKRRKQLDSAWISEENNQAAKEEELHLVCTKEDHDLVSSLPGRRSFGGFNKAVERNYEHMMDEKRFDKASERASKNSVSDAEMLARYENLIGLPRGPSQGMRPKQEKTTKQKEDQKKNASNHSR